MNNKSIVYKSLLFLGLIICLSACKSNKTIINNDGTVASKNQEQLIDDILKAQLDYKTVNGKISLELITGNKSSGMKVNSRLKIVRDDIIQLSILAPFINTEVIRVNITPDSIFLIDRMAKKYAVEDIKKLEKEKNIQFNYSNMQAMFTNSLFVPGKKSISKSDYDAFSITQNSGKYVMQTKDKSGITYNFTIDSNDRVIDTNIAGGKKETYSMQWMYEEFIKDGAYLYPTKMTSKVNIMKKQVTLNMSYSSLDINKEMDVDKSLPSKYERVTLGEILNNYIK